MKKLFVGLSLLIPFHIASASIANELNSFLDHFFANPNQPVYENTVSRQLIESIEIPENPTQDDVEALQKQIIESETNLEQFEAQLQQKENDLWMTQLKKQSAIENVRLLDQQLSIQTQKLEKIQANKALWQKELEKITRQKSDIKAQIRAYEEDYENSIVQDVIRKQSLMENRNVQLLKWFFSSKTISQILEEQSAKNQKQTQNQEKIKRLKKAQQFLENKETHTVLLYQTIKELEHKIAQEKKTYADFVAAKAQLTSQFDTSEENLQRELSNAYQERESVLGSLQNLRQAWVTLKESLPEKPLEQTALFQFPLKKPIKINIGFQNPEYEKEFGIVHDGVDFFAPQGSDVLAPAEGIVQKVEISEKGYAYLILNHGNDLYTVYGHVSEILVNEGDTVEQGVLIAQTGGTPGTKGAGYLTTGPHLHFSVFQNGEFVDPLFFLPSIKE